MKATETQALPAPPSLISALLAGFDTITNHIGLILFPIGFDLLLWLGPHLRLETLIKNIVGQLPYMPGMNTPENAEAVRLSQELWLVMAERLNILAFLRTYPVGVPSLMSGRQPLETPLGSVLMLDIPSFWGFVGLWTVLVLSGLAAGALYFLAVSQASLDGKVDWSQVIAQWRWALIQVILLTLLLSGLLLLIGIPASCLLSMAMFGGLPLGQFGILLVGGILVWALFPLVLSAHGIFIYKYQMWISISQGVRLTRMTLVRTSMLFVAIFLISEGLNTLWRVPAEASWLSLVGVVGHAFVATSLLAASFIYYRDATRWIQRLVQQNLMSASAGHIRERKF